MDDILIHSIERYYSFSSGVLLFAGGAASICANLWNPVRNGGEDFRRFWRRNEAHGLRLGAMSGGTMGLGLWQGTADPSDRAAKEHAYQLVGAFQEEFKNRCGALDCADLLGTNTSAPEWLEKARAEGRFASRLRLIVGMLLEKC